MSYPFLGMNSWLEDVKLWRNVHASLITAIRDELVPDPLIINYSQPPRPSLSAADMVWAMQYLAANGSGHGEHTPT
jgi:hypothetical protein